MRYAATFLAAFFLFSSLSACATVSPYGADVAEPRPEAQAYAEVLLEKAPETLTEARNTQAQAQFEQGVFFVSGGITLLSSIILIIDRLL